LFAKFLFINYYLKCLARKAAGIPVVKEMTIGVGFINTKYFLYNANFSLGIDAIPTIEHPKARYFDDHPH